MAALDIIECPIALTIGVGHEIARRARSEGAAGCPCVGRYSSVLDNFERILGSRPTVGLVAVDRVTQARRPKAERALARRDRPGPLDLMGLRR